MPHDAEPAGGLSRRSFLKLGAAGAAAPLAAARPDAGGGAVGGSGHSLAGKPLPPWRRGEFQVHFIYTGVAESMFWIMPDGTTMLLDCGDHPAWKRGKKSIWILPDGYRNAGEWIARYVTRVNPGKQDVDYMMISHHHADHAGMENWNAGTREWNGETLSVGGFLQAADTLRFGHGFDRGWPDFNDPIPDEFCDRNSYPHVRKTLSYLAERDGMKMERFRVGAADQVALLKDAASFPTFRVVNIAGNGKILRRSGEVLDLYADRHDARKLSENAMSLGLVAEYGPFRFYTAGDFFGNVKHKDGTRVDIEVELAKELGPVDVAKVDHHGHHSMATELVSALRARVWTACVWDTAHMTADTLERLSSREAYPGPRLVAPGVFPPERRLSDAGSPFMADIAPESFGAGHVVVTVAPGGETYTVAYVTADDESMLVTGAYDFTSRCGRACQS